MCDGEEGEGQGAALDPLGAVPPDPHPGRIFLEGRNGGPASVLSRPSRKILKESGPGTLSLVGSRGKAPGLLPFFPVVDVQAAADTARRAITVIRWAR
jgi:hypothetical protein